MFAATVRNASRSVLLRTTQKSAASVVPRVFFSAGQGKDVTQGNDKVLDSINKALGASLESDLEIPTDRDRKFEKEELPDFLPDDVKKDMKTLGLESINDLDEMEEENIDGYSDLGLVPPEGSGTYQSPILVPSRRASRKVGFVDPPSHSVMWFTIQNDDSTYYVRELGLFFKMLHIDDGEDEHEEHAHH